MTEIAVPESRAELAVAEPSGSSLMAWAREAREAAEIAANLANTSFVPASLRGKPVEITAAILAGHELGLQPMATLRSMDVIQGTPALRAHAMRGLVQSKGHQVELVEASPGHCVMRGRRRGEERWQTVTWTMQRAALLGLTNKDQWKKQPQTMLIARATGEVCRLIAADVLFAMPYASEELQVSDGSEVEVQVAVPRVTVEEIVGSAGPVSQPVQKAPQPSPAPPGEEDPRRPDLHLWTEEQIAEAFPGAVRQGVELIVPRRAEQEAPQGPASGPSWDGVEYPPEEEQPAAGAPSDGVVWPTVARPGGGDG